MGMAIFLGVVTYLSTSNTATAETQATNPPVKKAAKTKTSQAKSPLREKSAKAPPSVITEESALATFDTFTIEWMQKLVQAEDFHKSQAHVVEAPDGFAAEYVGYTF
jgi:hypothetical protein